MSKISELSDGGVVQGGDTLIAVRSGGNVKVTYGGSTTANIDGGTIDDTVIGGTTPAAVTTTALVATTADINAGTIDGTVIGGTTAAAGTFTTGQFDTSVNVDGTVTSDNVEIGTLGASDANAIIDLTGDTTYTDFGFRIIRNSGANGRTDLRHRGTGDFVIETVEAAEIAFETSDTERMRITSTGNVGIGTSSPACPLHVRTPGTGGIKEIARFDAVGNGAAGRGSKISIAAPGSQTSVDVVELIGFQNSNDTVAGNAAFAINVAAATTGTLTERMRIDSSGNLLVGTTSVGIGDAGIELRADGQITGTRSGNVAALLNRLSTDGDIVNFRKDGTTVGSIGTRAGYVKIGNGDTNLLFNSAANAITPEDAAANSDGILDLGRTTSRFKDLYLSGGVYLGGTAEANKLDDYEEGTWTPVDVSGAAVALSSVTATYRKIGKSVTYFMEATVATTSSGAGILIGGLPFAPANDNFVGAFHNTGGNDYVALTNAATVRIQIYPLGSSSVAIWNTLSADIIRATGTYFTA